MTDLPTYPCDPGPRPCPACGGTFPGPADRGVITCENGHGWGLAIAGNSDTGPVWTVRPVAPEGPATT